MIITIGREHGSNGHDIARALAAELGYTCFDKEIVDTAAENSNFSKEILHSYDEKRVSPYIVRPSLMRSAVWPTRTTASLSAAVPTMCCATGRICCGCSSWRMKISASRP